jgi:hypothetical protein
MVTNRDRKLFGSRQKGKIPKFAQTTGTVGFLILFQEFRNPLRGELLYGQVFGNGGPHPLTRNALLFSY